MMRGKGGKFYVPLLVAFMIIFLVVAYIKVVGFYSQFEGPTDEDKIGEKQAAIMRAIRAGERIQLYVRQAAELAAQQPAALNPCGEAYLDSKLVGTGGCEDDVTRGYQQELSAYLAQYPEGQLTDIIWKNNTIDGQDVLEGIKRIPVDKGVERAKSEGLTGGTFSGTFADWPVPTTFSRKISSDFGGRNLNGQSGSRNHGGLDISTQGQAGVPILSLGAGKAKFYDRGQNSFVQVRRPDGLILDYVHVSPTHPINANNEIDVVAGQQIAVTRPYNPTPHLHLQVSYIGISEKAAENSWPGMVGGSQADIPVTYATTSGRPAAPAKLDPVCFFDRETITQVLRDSSFYREGVFAACDAYERDYKLSERVTTATETETTGQGMQEAPVPVDEYPEVLLTKENLEKHNTYRFIEEAAAEQEVDAKLLLAIITQESRGEPAARSPTGAIGIAQFTSGTARGFSEFTKITPCCSEAEAIAGTCNHPRVYRCTPQNDDRFNPQRSIQAQAKKVKDDFNHYKDQGYEQHAALTLAAYNGGRCPVNAALNSMGDRKTATWDEVKAAILALDEESICRSGNIRIDKEQITDYVDQVLKWYAGWGGTTIAGTPFSSEQVGYYDVRLVINNGEAAAFDRALRDIHTRAKQCTGDLEERERCVEAVVANAARSVGLHAVRETLDETDGCMDAATRAQANIANQFAWCDSSPDSACGCPFTPGPGATYSVSAGSTRILSLEGKEVRAESGMPGIAYTHAVDDDTKTVVQVLHAGQLVGNGAETTMQIGTQRMRVQVARDNSPDPWMQFSTIYKAPNSLAFTADSVEQCVLPAKPQAFCLRTDDRNTQLVFYVTAQGLTEPQGEITVLEQEIAISSGVQHARIQFTSSEHHPYLYAMSDTVPEDFDGERRFTDYLVVHRVADLTTAAERNAENLLERRDYTQEQQQLLADAQRGIYSVLYDGERYETILPDYGLLRIAMMDASMERAAEFTVPRVDRAARGGFSLEGLDATLLASPTQ